MRAGLTHTVTHPHRFETDTSRRFLYDVCDRLAQRGVVRVFVLKVRGCVVATRIAFVVGEPAVPLLFGLRPPLGEVQRLDDDRGRGDQVRDRARASTAANLSTGTDVSKTRWGARLVAFPEAIQPHPRLRSRVTYAAYQSLLDGAQNRWLTPIIRTLPRRAWG